MTAYPILKKDIHVEWEISVAEARITDDDIILATKPSSWLRKTHMIYLRKGNEYAGLKHIHAYHERDFKELDETIADEEN